MRTALVVLALSAGCVSTTNLDYAQRNVQGCEYQLAQARAAGDQARAARIAPDCEWWARQAEMESGRVDRDLEQRRAVAQAGQAMAQANQNSQPVAAPAVHCTSNTMGGTTFTNCN